ncbi:hypothetical protein TNCV_1263331 [Trichonephila clavipes]|nr:hypothetical protein TNCV_1263331 [Trichonephila clavipes]
MTSLNILDLVARLSSRHCIYFQWVPSHIGLNGSEIVDSLSKSTTADTLRLTRMVSDHGLSRHEFEPSTTKTRRVGQRCTLNLSRAETSSRWCGVVVRRGGASSGVVHVT